MKKDKRKNTHVCMIYLHTNKARSFSEDKIHSEASRMTDSHVSTEYWKKDSRGV